LKLLKNTNDIDVLGAFPNCTNIEEEIRLLRPHLVLLDIHLPVISGIEAIKIIKQINAEIKILIPNSAKDLGSLFLTF
jgi:DNA-binding NarL/FixJ family response regulator